MNAPDAIAVSSHVHLMRNFDFWNTSYCYKKIIVNGSVSVSHLTVVRRKSFRQRRHRKV